MRPETIDGSHRSAWPDADTSDVVEADSAVVDDTTRTSARDAAAQADADIVAASASAIEALADPAALQQVVQSWLRDLGLEVRERGADASASRAEAAAEVRSDAMEDARLAAERAANDGLIAKICGYIASGLALIGGAIGAAFTGGATLALGIAAVILVAGATTTQVLVDVGAVPATEGGAVALGCNIAATICSFGATAAGSAGSAISSTARIALDAINYTASALGTINGGMQCLAAANQFDADRSVASADEAGVARDESYDAMDADIDGVRELMRNFSRMAARLQAVRDVADESRRAAMLRA